MSKTFDDLRAEYLRSTFSESEAADEPMDQFRGWFEAAVAEGVPLANAAALSTVSETGSPSSRMVLLKDYDDLGFVFYTNYDSRKGRELDANPRAALLFWWVALERQIRIEGTCERTSAAESDAYFATRPRASNLSAMASHQSQVVASRAALEEAVAAVDAGQPLQRPPHWGGYRLIPTRMEFWQGRADRLHDRLQYRRSAGAWIRERLSP